MSRYNEIENRMKSVVDNHATTAPAFVWDNVEAALSEGKDNRKFWLFYLAGFMVLSFGIYYVLFGHGMEALPPTSSSSMSLVVDKTQKEKVENQEVAELINTQEAQENNSVVVSSNTGQASTIVPAVAENTTGVERHHASTARINHAAESTTNITSHNSLATTVVERSTNEIQNNPTILVAEEKMEDSNASNTMESRETLDAMAFVNGLSLNLEAERVEPVLKNSVECPSFKNSVNLHLFVEGNLFLGRHFKSIGDGSDATLAAARRGSEKSWYSWGGNAAAGIHINPALYVGAGVEWTQSKDKFYYEKESLIKMVINFDPISGLPIDTSFVTGKLLNKGEIRYTTIDIPIFVGYVKNMGGWEMGVEGGVLFNMSFAADGKVFNASNDISRINLEPTIYKSKIGLGLKTGLVFRKYWKNGMSFQVKPTYKMYFDDIQDPSYSLPMSMKFARVEVGIRKDF